MNDKQQPSRADAQGSLQRRSLASLLAYITRQQLSGVLQLTDSHRLPLLLQFQSGHIAAWFEPGQPPGDTPPLTHVLPWFACMTGAFAFYHGKRLPDASRRPWPGPGTVDVLIEGVQTQVPEATIRASLLIAAQRPMRCRTRPSDMAHASATRLWARLEKAPCLQTLMLDCYGGANGQASTPRDVAEAMFGPGTGKDQADGAVALDDTARFAYAMLMLGAIAPSSDVPHQGVAAAQRAPMQASQASQQTAAFTQSDDHKAGDKANGSAASTLDAASRSGPKQDNPTQDNPAPEDLEPALRARWAEVVAAAKALPASDPFAQLGVAIDADDAAVRSAYLQGVRTWHPDKLPKPLRPLRRDATRVFQAIEEAFQLLSSESLRETQRQTLQSRAKDSKRHSAAGKSEQSEAEAVLQAAVKFQEVKVLLRRGEWDGALAMLDGILALCPDEPDYLAALGHALFHRHGIGNRGAIEQAHAALEKALGLQPHHEDALVTKGKIASAVGDASAALTVFERVLVLHPDNVDAMRAVRLAELRGLRKGGAAEQKISGRVAGKKAGDGKTLDAGRTSLWDRIKKSFPPVK